MKIRKRIWLLTLILFLFLHLFYFTNSVDGGNEYRGFSLLFWFGVAFLSTLFTLITLSLLKKQRWKLYSIPIIYFLAFDFGYSFIHTMAHNRVYELVYDSFFKEQNYLNQGWVYLKGFLLFFPIAFGIVLLIEVIISEGRK